MGGGRARGVGSRIGPEDKTRTKKGDDFVTSLIVISNTSPVTICINYSSASVSINRFGSSLTQRVAAQHLTRGCGAGPRRHHGQSDEDAKAEWSSQGRFDGAPILDAHAVQRDKPP